MEIEFIVRGEKYAAEEGDVSEGAGGIWHIFDKNEIYLGTIVPSTGGYINSSVEDNSLWGDIRDKFCDEFDALLRKISGRDDIHEIKAPETQFYENGIETLSSCIDSTEYVLSARLDDLYTLVVRSLQNQRAIMTALHNLTSRG